MTHQVDPLEWNEALESFIRDFIKWLKPVMNKTTRKTGLGAWYKRACLLIGE